MVGCKLKEKIFPVLFLCLFWSLIVDSVYANGGNQMEINNVPIIKRPYQNYDRKYLDWKDGMNFFLRDQFIVEITLFIDTLVDGYKNQAIFRSNKTQIQEFIRKTIKNSKRLRWQLVNGSEERLTIEKMAAGEITFIKENERHTLYITIVSFQERSSGYYLEFKNSSLKKWVDEKVREWAKENKNVKSYDVESAKKMNIVEWYDRNTRFH